MTFFGWRTMGTYLLGVDIGTQGVKAGLFDSADGRCLASAFRPSRLFRPRPGVVEEDPEFQLASVCAVIRQCVRRSGVRPRAVAAAAVAGQMAGIIGIGADGRAVTPYDSWLDTRCEPYIEVMRRRAGEEIVAITGGAASFNHGPRILRWMHERPRDFRRIRRFVQPGGYAALRLCGLSAERAFIDHTYLHFSGFADNRTRRWDEDLCRRFALDPARLPRIVEPQEVVGEVTSEMSRRCGLASGTPLAAGCGDTAASFLACGATREGVCVDVAGTASVFAATTRAFRPDAPRGMLAWGRSATPGLWHPYAYINGGGMNLEWFRRELAGAGGTRATPAVGFDALDRLAGKTGAAEADAPLFVPHLGGRVCPPEPRLRGAWVGLNWSHTLGHLYRAVLEGVALEYGLYRQRIAQLCPRLRLTELRVTGGGETSAVWNSIKADVLQMPVVQVARGGGAPMGSAMLAGAGVGALKSLPDAARTWVVAGERTRPRKSLRKRYRARLRRYQRLLELMAKEAE
jgi:xylulokinase